MALERLQKIISRSGMASRRRAEEWILQGRVTVNASVVRKLGSKADLIQDHIAVNGRKLRAPGRMIYLALHKPRNYVTTRSDPQGRATVMDLLKGVKERVYPVGRLDYHSEGLLLLTSDGEWANHLTSAASGITKTYWVKVSGVPEEKELEKLRQGVVLDGRRTLPARIRPLRPADRKTARSGRVESLHPWYEVSIQEGRQNQIRRLFERIGHPVKKLKRVKIGALTLGTLPVGQFRYLTPAEARLLPRKNPLRGSNRNKF